MSDSNPIKQQGRLLEIATPLGPDKLLLRRLSGRMELSRPFEFDLALSSADPSIAFDDIVGQNVTVGLLLADGTRRPLNGYISQFEQVDAQGLRHSEYRATLVPWLWFLTRTSDCRIFQEKKVPEILQQVFSDNGFTDVEDRLNADNYRKWEYCVQYRETDFNFVSRLMEQEGIYYFFKHEEGKHTLVLCDTLSKHDTAPGYESIRFQRADDENKKEESILTWSVNRCVQPGSLVLKDYNFKTPKTVLRSRAEMAAQHSGAKGEVFEYPGNYTDGGEGDRYARVRMESLRAPHEVVRGTSDARGLAAGFRFKLTDFAREDQNREYLVTNVQYKVVASLFESGERKDEEETAECNFEAIPADVQFRPPRQTPKPIVQGPQTAVIVGPAGEEIYTDPHGRVKAQFFWDRYGEFDESSSCWMRVSQVHAGKAFGGIDLPRIGEEVIVSFLEGDPDSPLITGRVYNQDQTPPFALPGKKVVSGLKSNSTKGGGGYNEFSMDDTKGTEKITIHGQYDMDTTVEHDQRDTIHNNRTTNVDVDDTETVGSKQTITVGADQATSVGANQTTKVGSNQTVTVGGNQSETVGGNQSTSVGGSQSASVSGSRSAEVAGSESLTVGGGQSVSVGGGASLSAGSNVELTAGANATVTSSANAEVTAGANVTITAGATIKLVAGGSSITIGASGITISTGGIITESASMIKHNT